MTPIATSFVPPLLALAIFGVDLLTPPGLIVGVLYAGVVLLALSGRDRRRVVGTAWLCTGLIVLAAAAPRGASVNDVTLINRLLTALVVWATALLGLRHHAVVAAMASREDLERLNRELRKEILERQQMEEILRRSQKHLSQAQEIALIGSWDWNLASGAMTWSAEMYRIHGLDPESAEMPYERAMQWVHPDDRERTHAVLRRTAESGAAFRFHYRIVRGDGAVRTLQARGEGQVDAGGRLVRILGTGQDITELKQAEEQLEQSRQQLRALSAHLQSVREEERTRIAREIHDELGQALTALKIDLSWMSRQTSEPAMRQKIQSMVDLVNETIQTVRRIATELRPAILDDLGLPAALEWQAQEFQKRTGIRCELKISRDLPVGPRASTELFRVFQEILTNAARHAHASRVAVSFRLQGHDLILEVQDDGVGIHEKDINDPRSIGLTGMRERVQLLDGDIDITGIPGRGTTVTVRIPAERVRHTA